MSSLSPACQAGVCSTGLLMIEPVGLDLGGNTGTKYPTSISWALNKVIVILQLWDILKGQELDPQCNTKALRVGIKSKA